MFCPPEINGIRVMGPSSFDRIKNVARQKFKCFNILNIDFEQVANRITPCVFKRNIKIEQTNSGKRSVMFIVRAALSHHVAMLYMSTNFFTLRHLSLATGVVIFPSVVYLHTRWRRRTVCRTTTPLHPGVEECRGPGNPSNHRFPP